MNAISRTLNIRTSPALGMRRGGHDSCGWSLLDQGYLLLSLHD